MLIRKPWRGYISNGIAQTGTGNEKGRPIHIGRP